MSKELKPEGVMTAHSNSSEGVIYPTVLVEVDGIKMHALLNTSARSSYAPAKLIKALSKRPRETKTKKIDMMLGSTTTQVEIYSATLSSVDGKFEKERTKEGA